ncbi:MAG TPA: FecR domain-containing protein [Candidatus Paceibacterota bacterium]|nr:FecR domain-containing protein [Candidatus Paceibacterota bacterium]
MSHELLTEHGVTPELAGLAEKFYLQALSEPENRRLNDLLRDDGKARSFLLAYGSIHARLSWEYGPTLADKPLAQLSRVEDEGCHPRPDRSNQEASGFNWLAWFSQRRPLLVRLGGAFAVLALGLGVFLVTRLRPSQPEPLAVVTRCLGVQTADSRGDLRSGQGLGPGRLTLEAGTVEVTIQNGARILLEGPATLELLTPLRAYLQAGRAVVHVPEAASGFVIETRDANVLDVGTEFGVKVGPDRGTEVQVYQGSVFTAAKSAAGRTNSPQRLLAGSAARLDPDATEMFQTLPFAPDRFVRQLPETKAGSKDTLPLSNQPRWDRIEIMPASQPVAIDGNLSEWDRQRMFRSQCDGAKDHGVEGALMYDADYLYLGAHVADPAPMRNVIDPATDGDAGWKGGGLQVRLSTDRNLGWPVDANADIYYQGQPMTQRPQDLNERIVHLTLWHHAPGQKDCLHVSYGMDFHGGQTNPSGYRAAFRKDADERGYTLEYAIPWALLKAQADPPRAGDILAATWTVHWSDDSGRRWRGQLVEIRNPSEPPRNNPWDRAAGWGKAMYR